MQSNNPQTCELHVTSVPRTAAHDPGAGAAAKARSVVIVMRCATRPLSDHCPHSSTS